MYKKINSISSKGFTVVEIIIVIAVIVILASIAIPYYAEVERKAEYAVDSSSIAILNNATATYAAMQYIEVDEVFPSELSDNEKIDFLVNQRYLTEEVEPTQNDAIFVWLDDANLWAIQGSYNSADSDVPESSYSAWETGTKYTKGTYVTHNDKTYYSHKATKKEPGKHKNWQEVSDYWVKLNLYKKGDTIIHNGETYIAKKNSRNKDPESKPNHWLLFE